MNKCGITSCNTLDNHFLWACKGTCNRHFHAACVGVQRHQEEFLRTFMLPLCIECQEEFRDHLELKKLIKQQKSLTEHVKAQVESTHALLNKFKSVAVTHEALDAMEEMLTELRSDQKLINSATNNTNNTANGTASKLNEISSQLEGIASDINNNEILKPLNSTIAEAFSRIEESIMNRQHDIWANNTSEKLSSGIIMEILDEVKAFNSKTPECSAESLRNIVSELKALSTESSGSSIADELEELNKSKMSTENEGPTPGWRIIGNKKIWKRDWRGYDARQRNRRLQERNADKARRRRKQRNHNTTHNSNRNGSRRNHSINNNNSNISTYRTNTNTSNTNYNNSSSSTGSGRNFNNKNINNSNTDNCITPNYSNTNNNEYNSSNSNSNNVLTSKTLPLDKDLLAAARIQFSGPPNEDVTSKFIHFQKGETINPYRTEKSTTSAICNDKSNAVPTNPGSQFELDPLRPPIVRLTEQSSEGDQRFLKARLRDPKIMRVVRLYLAYMKDQSPNVCVEGMTATSIKMLLRTEGLPTSPGQLESIFTEVHQEYGMNPEEALSDLTSYRNFLTSERTCHLQRVRESTSKFYSSNFRK